MTRSNTYSQQEQGWMVYPGRGWRKFLFKLPLYRWRLGLARLLSPNYLLLTITGRKSGQTRRTMLEYTYANGHIYLSSGWGKRSQWVQNVLANPLVTVQTVREGTVSGKAIPVTDEQEMALFYARAQGHSPIWKEYLTSWGIADNVQDFVLKRERLCVLHIDPVDEPNPPPLTADRKWVWLVFGLMALVLMWIGRPSVRSATARKV